MLLHHVDLGGAGKPPMVILHGLLGSARNWQTAGRDMARHYHVFALDARNHGRSPHDPEMTFDAMVGDVLGWMDRAGIARADIVGHSLGGRTAMHLACRHPERVARLVIVDVSPRRYEFIGLRDEFEAMASIDLAALKSRAEAEELMAAKVPNPGARKFLATNLERDAHGRWRWIVNLPVLAAALPRIEQDVIDDSARYDGPTLFIAGGRSDYIRPVDHACIRRHFPQARIVTIPEAGHIPHTDSREEFVRAVLAD